ncbi:MAG: helix-turn-helix domain-containing protein [Synergistaceae bacterium]|nr:helix-turn-helix domain-containing protein [Bacilli bacterium]MBR0075040.1 helix-turn-helix domain-containing protein [Synergistaceae bacterium]
MKLTSLKETLKNVLTVAQACEELEVGKSQLQKLCKNGKLAGAEKLGGVWFIPAEAVKLYKGVRLKKRRKKKTDENS